MSISFLLIALPWYYFRHYFQVLHPVALPVLFQVALLAILLVALLGTISK